MHSYRFPPQPLKGKLLALQIGAAGLPTDLDLSYEGDPPNAILVRRAEPLSTAQQTLLGQVIAAHDATALTPAEQEAQTEEVQALTERDAARTAWAQLRDAPAATPLTVGMIRPMLRYLVRRKALD